MASTPHREDDEPRWKMRVLVVEDDTRTAASLAGLLNAERQVHALIARPDVDLEGSLAVSRELSADGEQAIQGLGTAERPDQMSSRHPQPVTTGRGCDGCHRRPGSDGDLGTRGWRRWRPCGVAAGGLFELVV